MAQATFTDVNKGTFIEARWVERQMRTQPFGDPDVKAVFDAYPARLRTQLLKLRQLIFVTAADTDDVGELVETLKWGQPAYLTERPRTGTTIRIGAVKGQANNYAMYFHCQTMLVPTFRELYSDSFIFQGKRALLFSLNDKIPQDALKHCIALALTYHSRPRPL